MRLSPTRNAFGLLAGGSAVLWYNLAENAEAGMPTWKTTWRLDPQSLPCRERWPAPATAEALAEAQGLIEPRAVYEILPATAWLPAGVLLAGGAILHSPALARSLGSAGRLLLAACTIGPGLEARCQERQGRGELSRAFLLDALGVVALQELGRRLERHLATELAPQGLRLGCPCFPGQGDWPLEDQRTLFAILRPERIAIRLNENCLMVPLKSASMTFPVGSEEELPAGVSTCARCERRESCPYAQ